jgi:predicted Zn-dependent protease
LDRAVKPLTDSLPQAQIPYKFYLVDDPEPNAFALPGGHVVVTKGLMELAERPEQIVGAVAHEIAHVNRKHHLREQISNLGPYIIFQLFVHGEGRLLGVIGAGSQLLIKQSFSQEYELEADATGWDYLVKAHIDPRGSIELLKKFKAEEDRYKDLEIMPQAFSSHPGTDKRIKILESRWRKLTPKTGFIDLGSWDQHGTKPAP